MTIDEQLDNLKYYLDYFITSKALQLFFDIWIGDAPMEYFEAMKELKTTNTPINIKYLWKDITPMSFKTFCSSTSIPGLCHQKYVMK